LVAGRDGSAAIGFEIDVRGNVVNAAGITCYPPEAKKPAGHKIAAMSRQCTGMFAQGTNGKR
jgi:hypothetical protein